MGGNMGADFNWRDEVKQRPLAWSLGALGVGLLAGCAVSRSFKKKLREDQGKPEVLPSVPHSDAARPIIGERLSATTAAQKAALLKTEPRKPEPVKGHAAADRLHQELVSLRDRFIDELSNLAHQVLLPALISKIREALVSDKRATRAQPPVPRPD
jgi:hypothetical protein